MHMAKQWPEKVVQRSFIKGHSFPNGLYMLEILNSSSISFLFSYTIPRAFLMKQYATLKYAKYALIGDANVKDASKCVTFQYVRYSIRNRARSHDFEVFSSCSKVYVLRTRKD